MDSLKKFTLKNKFSPICISYFIKGDKSINRLILCTDNLNSTGI
jgi:hypothetical protein